jgi:hypothetical protein
MSKKTDILVNLKQQVMILKSQLDLINRKKMSISPGHHQSKSKGQRPSRTASRFDSNCLDGEIIGRFTNRQDTSHNLSELILNKSIEGKIPRISPYRKAEYIKTKENFDTEPMDLSPRQTALRNPLTG